ncbi:hypothetical protein EON83_04080 [bacterium]|nr:MAG: hypothetical protein EON83_04080 [bacterium]
MKSSQLSKLTLLSVLATSSLSVAFAQQTQPLVNLARNKTFVSSDPNKSGWDKNLTDGSWRPEKATTYASGNSETFPKNVTIDLTDPVAVGYVVVGVPGFGSTKTVAVSVSEDGTTYKEVGRYVFSVKKEEKHLFSFPEATARYVRLNYIDHYDEKVEYPITHAFTTEVEVYAPGVTPVLAPIVGLDKPDVAAPKYDKDNNIQATFQARHEAFLQRGKEGPIGVLFLGDSITQGWSKAKTVWQEHFGPYNPANFGIGGDRTQHVLWRIENGELDGITPKVVVLMIGTNNMGNTAEDIIKGDKKIVEQIHLKLPNTKVMLLGIFPRETDAKNPRRAKIKEVNAELAKLDDGDKTRYLDIGDKFLEADGTLTKEIMPDYLHPDVKGYQIWADAIQPLLDEMMKP